MCSFDLTNTYTVERLGHRFTYSGDVLYLAVLNDESNVSAVSIVRPDAASIVVPHGSGVWYYPSGDVFFDGSFYMGGADGYGTMFDDKGRKVRTGTYKADMDEVMFRMPIYIHKQTERVVMDRRTGFVMQGPGVTIGNGVAFMGTHVDSLPHGHCKCIHVDHHGSWQRTFEMEWNGPVPDVALLEVVGMLTYDGPFVKGTFADERLLSHNCDLYKAMASADTNTYKDLAAELARCEHANDLIKDDARKLVDTLKRRYKRREKDRRRRARATSGDAPEASEASEAPELPVLEPNEPDPPSEPDHSDQPSEPDHSDQVSEPDAPDVVPPSDAPDLRSTECVVCLDGTRSHIFVPCGHLCLCSTCAAGEAVRECPLCRTAPTAVLRVYG